MPRFPAAGAPTHGPGSRPDETSIPGRPIPETRGPSGPELRLREGSASGSGGGALLTISGIEQNGLRPGSSTLTKPANKRTHMNLQVFQTRVLFITGHEIRSPLRSSTKRKKTHKHTQTSENATLLQGWQATKRLSQQFLPRRSPVLRYHQGLPCRGAHYYFSQNVRTW